VDSAALLTEPTLDAWGVPRAFLTATREGDDVAAAMARARLESRPVALLLTEALA
jgi:hypothetical protein